MFLRNQDAQRTLQPVPVPSAWRPIPSEKQPTTTNTTPGGKGIPNWTGMECNLDRERIMDNRQMGLLLPGLRILSPLQVFSPWTRRTSKMFILSSTNSRHFHERRLYLPCLATLFQQLYQSPIPQPHSRPLTPPRSWTNLMLTYASLHKCALKSGNSFEGASTVEYS